MGLLQQAVATYDDLQAQGYVGQLRDGQTVLAPVSHMITRAELEITLDKDGHFVSGCTVDKDEPKIIIPVTESSSGRTSGVCAHPLCDQLGYVAPYNEKKHAAYLEQLEQWAASPYTHPTVQAVLAYVKGGTILSDLANAGVIELKDNHQPKDEKLLVRWRVQNSDTNDACWTDPTLFQAFIHFYESLSDNAPKTVCMITGQQARAAMQHPKGIVSVYGNAKLISANDATGFTYRGRFSEPEQAASISYEASQKAHSALRWLIENQGETVGGRTFICWNPKTKKLPNTLKSLLSGVDAVIATPEDYSKQLRDTLSGWQTTLAPTDGVVIAAFDAATSGRLAMTYYNELRSSDFLQRLYDWDNTCAWENNQFGIQSPALWQIVQCAFGTQQGERLKTDDRVLRQQIQRLLACRLNRAKMPTDILHALVQRASMPQAYDWRVWRQILFVACAVVRKHRSDMKEEWSMALDIEKADRSYQFGRLLAVLEKIEKDTYSKDDTRETNAIRLLSIYVRRPFQTFQTIYERVRVPYYSKLPYGARTRYEKLLEEILGHIDGLGLSDEALNRPLKETYLMGYYLQQQALYQPQSEKTEE